MINHKLKFLYTHYPKCAGTAIRQHLIENYSDGIDQEIEKVQYRHCSLTTTLDRLHNLDKDPLDYYKFSFCRNPWDLCVSYYFFMRDKMPKHLESIGRPQNKITKFCMQNSFSDFVISDLCTSYYDKIYTHASQFLIDFIIRQENLNSDFDHVCDVIGIPRVELPIVNNTEHDDYRTYYTPETMRVVKSKFVKEIDKFNYDY